MNSSNRKVFTGSTPPHKRNIVLDDDAEMRYDASQLAMAIQEPLDDDAEDMGDYEGRQAECDLADALDDLPF